MSGNAAAPSPAWLIEFCDGYTPFLFSAGKWTIIAGILLGIAVAAAKVILAFRVPAGGGSPGLETVPNTGLIETIKGFIEALTSAPTWLALFGGGLLLLWMAGNAVPEVCKPAPKDPPAQTRQGSSGGSPSTNAAGNSAAAVPAGR